MPRKVKCCCGGEIKFDRGDCTGKCEDCQTEYVMYDGRLYVECQIYQWNVCSKLDILQICGIIGGVSKEAKGPQLNQASGYWLPFCE